MVKLYMKLINKPIKLIATFSPDGKVTPTSFIYGSRYYRVTRVQDSWSYNSWEHGNIQHFKLQVMSNSGQEMICEAAFLQDKMRWVLVKI